MILYTLLIALPSFAAGVLCHAATMPRRPLTYYERRMASNWERDGRGNGSRSRAIREG